MNVESFKAQVIDATTRAMAALAGSPLAAAPAPDLSNMNAVEKIALGLKELPMQQPASPIPVATTVQHQPLRTPTLGEQTPTMSQEAVAAGQRAAGASVEGDWSKMNPVEKIAPGLRLQAAA